MIVVVSNRVARVQANEPVTGGLASALLPVVKNSGAIWVGSSGRIRDASSSDRDRQSASAHLEFDIRRTDEAAVQAALSGAGEMLGRQIARAAAGMNVTDTKVLFRVDPTA